MNPALLDAYLGLGSIYLKNDRLHDAFGQYARALEIQPDDPMAHLGMGGVFYKQGDFRRAIEHLERSIASRPWEEGSYGNLAMTLAILDLQEGGLQKHEAWFASRKGNAWIYERVGQWLDRSNRKSEARRAYVIAEAMKSSGF